MPLNVVIIGAGPAGEAAAKTAVKRGAQVILIERENAGGLCLNKGCVPSKTLLEQIHLLADGKRPNWDDIQKFKTSVVSGLRAQLETSLKTLKIKLVKGTATFSGPNSIDVASSAGTEKITFDKAILTGGTEIFYPAPLDQHIADLSDSDRILNMESTPESVVIVGGGAVGCEFACLLNAAGSKVIIVEMQAGLLPGEDAAIVAALTASFEARGIQIKTNATVKIIKKSAGGFSLDLSTGDALQTQLVLACVGRLPALDTFGLEKAGVEFDKRRLKLNVHLQTTNPNIYAAGDVTLQTRLAHAAAAQGEAAALNAMGQATLFDGSLVPRCLYSWPEVASVGRWKYELEAENKPVKASRAFFKGSAKAIAADEAEGFVQIISDPDSGKIMGAQIIGPHATELIHVFSIALKAGMTTTDLGQIIFAHPTLAEVIRDAARK